MAQTPRQPHLVMPEGRVDDLDFAERIEVRSPDGETIGWVRGFVAERHLEAVRRHRENPSTAISSDELRRQVGLPATAVPAGAG